MDVKKATATQAPGYPSRRQCKANAKALGLAAVGVGSLLVGGCYTRLAGVTLPDPPDRPAVEAELPGDMVVEPKPETPVRLRGEISVEPAQP